MYFYIQWCYKYTFIIFRQNRWRLPFAQMSHLTVKKTMTHQYKAVRSHLMLKIFCISRYGSMGLSNKINIVVVFWFYQFNIKQCVCIFVYLIFFYVHNTIKFLTIHVVHYRNIFTGLLFEFYFYTYNLSDWQEIEGSLMDQPVRKCFKLSVFFYIHGFVHISQYNTWHDFQFLVLQHHTK